MIKPAAVSSMFPFIRPPVTRPRDKENVATNINQLLFTDYFPLNLMNIGFILLVMNRLQLHFKRVSF